MELTIRKMRDNPTTNQTLETTPQNIREMGDHLKTQGVRDDNYLCLLYMGHVHVNGKMDGIMEFTCKNHFGNNRTFLNKNNTPF